MNRRIALSGKFLLVLLVWLGINALLLVLIQLFSPIFQQSFEQASPREIAPNFASSLLITLLVLVNLTALFIVRSRPLVFRGMLAAASVLFVVVICFVLLQVVAHGESPVLYLDLLNPPPQQGVIPYTCVTRGMAVEQNDVCTKRPDGTGGWRLTYRGGGGARLTPDGKSITFGRGDLFNPRIYIMNLDGTDMRLLVMGECLGWSADGKEIIYQKGGDRYIASVDGSNERVLKSGYVFQCDAPPGGQAYVFDPSATPTLRPTSTPTCSTYPDPAGRPAAGTPVVTGFASASSADWPAGEYSDSKVTGKREFSNGNYRWQTHANASSIRQYAFPEMQPVTDFTVSVDVCRTGGTENSRFGLVFRHSAPDSEYEFTISDFGTYAFGITRSGELDRLIPPTETAEIKPGQTNRLKVIARGPRFELYVNDQLVKQIREESLRQGITGVMVIIADAGDQAQFEFSNFELTVP